MTTMFREAPETDKNGNKIEGPVSARRVLAFVFALASVALFVAALFNAPQYGWVVYVPGGACLAGSLLLLFFTTITDVQSLIAAWKGVQK
jgi:heme/copper-type cytochrome/quinol oxidase subunit 1